MCSTQLSTEALIFYLCAHPVRGAIFDSFPVLSYNKFMATMMQHFVSSPTEDNKLAYELALQSKCDVCPASQGATQGLQQFPACERSI